MADASDSESLSESEYLSMDCFHHHSLSEFGDDTVLETQFDESRLQASDNNGKSETVPESQSPSPLEESRSVMATSSLETQTPMADASDSESLSESDYLSMDCFHHHSLSEFRDDTVPKTQFDESGLQASDNNGKSETAQESAPEMKEKEKEDFDIPHESMVPNTQLSPESMVPETLVFDDFADRYLTYREWEAKYLASGLLQKGKKIQIKYR